MPPPTPRQQAEHHQVIQKHPSTGSAYTEPDHAAKPKVPQVFMSFSAGHSHDLWVHINTVMSTPGPIGYGRALFNQGQMDGKVNAELMEAGVRDSSVVLAVISKTCPCPPPTGNLKARKQRRNGESWCTCPANGATGTKRSGLYRSKWCLKELMAAKEAKVPVVPVYDADKLTRDQAMEIMLAARKSDKVVDGISVREVAEYVPEENLKAIRNSTSGLNSAEALKEFETILNTHCPIQVPRRWQHVDVVEAEMAKEKRQHLRRGSSYKAAVSWSVVTEVSPGAAPDALPDGADHAALAKANGGLVVRPKPTIHKGAHTAAPETRTFGKIGHVTEGMFGPVSKYTGPVANANANGKQIASTLAVKKVFKRNLESGAFTEDFQIEAQKVAVAGVAAPARSQKPTGADAAGHPETEVRILQAIRGWRSKGVDEVGRDNVMGLVFHGESPEAFFIGMEWGGSTSLFDKINTMLRDQPKARGSSFRSFTSAGSVRFKSATADPYGEQKRQIFLQVIAGVKYLHSKDCCHLDLSSDNIVLHDPGGDGNMRVKITDFGLAMMAGDVRNPGGAKVVGLQRAHGKMAYMPPEMLELQKYGPGEDIDGPMVDIWSCGRVLLELFNSQKASKKMWASPDPGDPGNPNANPPEPQVPGDSCFTLFLLNSQPQRDLPLHLMKLQKEAREGARHDMPKKLGAHFGLPQDVADVASWLLKYNVLERKVYSAATIHQRLTKRSTLGTKKRAWQQRDWEWLEPSEADGTTLRELASKVEALDLESDVATPRGAGLIKM